MSNHSVTNRRRFVIGDIHGCQTTLQAMVEEALQLKETDTLYLLGDYIDRGPDSKGVLDYIMQMRESGYDVQALKGNHEELMLNAVADPTECYIWFGNRGRSTMREFGVETPEDIPQRY